MQDMSKEPENDPTSQDEAPAKESPAEPGDSAEEAFFNAPDPSELEDEIDPELVALPRRQRKRRHPLVSLVVMLLSLYLIWFLRTDLLFFMQSRTPVDKGQVNEALSKGTLEANTYVKLSGAPDRKHALLLEARFGGFESFVRLRQGGNHVFVQRHRSRRVTDKEVTSTHVGQLVRFTDLPYHEALQTNFRATMSLAHDLDFAAIKGPLASGAGPATVTDRKGREAHLAPDSQVWINVAFPNEWIVQFSKRAYATDAEPKKALDHIALPYAVDSETSRMFHRFVVHANPEQARGLINSFKDRSLHAGVVRRQLSYSARWEQLRVDKGALIIDARDPTFPSRFALDGETLKAVKDKVVSVPAEGVLYITTSSPFEVADDALVLITDRTPGDSWHYALLGLMLLIFALINGAILVLRLRKRSQKKPA
jgi:hypothetical protein